MIHSNRYGNFTSSEIWKLTTEGKTKGTFGKPAMTYIKEKEFEIKLGRSLSTDSFSYPTSWGNLVESHVYELLGLEYKFVSKEPIQHPTILRWKGTPDLITEDKVSDIKCPYTLKSFCELVEALEGGLEAFKDHAPEYYWQLISNAILTGKDTIELIVYVPFQSDLMKIRDLADIYDGTDPFQFKWVFDAPDKKLPYLIEGKDYKDLNIFQFPALQTEKDFLTDKVLKAINL